MQVVLTIAVVALIIVVLILIDKINRLKYRVLEEATLRMQGQLRSEMDDLKQFIANQNEGAAHSEDQIHNVFQEVA